MSEAYRSYASLLEQFIDNKLSAEQFQEEFFSRFKAEEKLDEALFVLLVELFGDLDAYTPSEELRREDPDYYLSENALRQKVVKVAQRLADLPRPRTPGPRAR